MANLAETNSRRQLNKPPVGFHYGDSPRERVQSPEILKGNPHFQALLKKLKDPTAPLKDRNSALEEAWKIHQRAWIYPNSPKRVPRTKLTPR